MTLSKRLSWLFPACCGGSDQHQGERLQDLREKSCNGHMVCLCESQLFKAVCQFTSTRTYSAQVQHQQSKSVAPGKQRVSSLHKRQPHKVDKHAVL
jgi:hypothetical protein